MHHYNKNQEHSSSTEKWKHEFKFTDKNNEYCIKTIENNVGIQCIYYRMVLRPFVILNHFKM